MNVITNTKMNAQEKVNKLKLIAEEIKLGKCNGLIWNRLIEQNPIEVALEALKTYKEAAEECHSEMDIDIVKELENTENDLAEILIANQNKPEIDRVIQNIYKSDKFGISAFRRIVPNDKNSELKWKIRSLLDLPEEVIVIIISKCEVIAGVQLMQVSKFFQKHADNQNIWKMMNLNDDLSLLDIYPDLNKVEDKKINWKKISFDRINNLDRLTSKDCLKIEFFSKNGKHFTDNLLLPCHFLDSKKINTLNIKKLAIKLFEFNCKPQNIILYCKGNDQQNWKKEWSIHECEEVSLKDLMLHKIKIEIISKEINYYEFGILIKPTNDSKSMRLYPGPKEIAPKKLPDEWLIEDINEPDELIIENIQEDSNRCKCIMF